MQSDDQESCKGVPRPQLVTLTPGYQGDGPRWAGQIRDELDALVAAEQQCCSFVSWSVTEVDGRHVLRVEAAAESPDDVAPIAELFGAL